MSVYRRTSLLRSACEIPNHFLQTHRHLLFLNLLEARPTAKFYGSDVYCCYLHPYRSRCSNFSDWCQTLAVAKLWTHWSDHIWKHRHECLEVTTGQHTSSAFQNVIDTLNLFCKYYLLNISNFITFLSSFILISLLATDFIKCAAQRRNDIRLWGTMSPLRMCHCLSRSLFNPIELNTKATACIRAHE